MKNILLIGIISVICGVETWDEMKQYVHVKEDFLRSFLKLPNGIPSHDILNRVFLPINLDQFETCFVQWVNALVQLNPKEVIVIDGKAIRGAKAKGEKSPIHMISAWSSENNLVLGQVKISEKSNEIIFIPKLLQALLL